MRYADFCKICDRIFAYNRYPYLVQFALKMCVAAWKGKKFTTTPYFGGSRLFTVINVGTPRAHQQCLLWWAASLCLSATVLTLDELIRFLRQYTSVIPYLHQRGISRPNGTKFGHKKQKTVCYHMAKTRSLYLTWALIDTRLWQTDRRTDGRTE